MVHLQETRVSIGKSITIENLYNSSWGFMHKYERSLWTESEHSEGGVAMLLIPYSSVTEIIPWSEAHWTPHWMAVQLKLLVESVLAVNVYAPSVKTEQKSMFESLLLFLQPYDGPMFVNGDFNCTLEPRLDRSFIYPPGRRNFLALRRLLGRA